MWAKRARERGQAERRSGLRELRRLWEQADELAPVVEASAAARQRELERAVAAVLRLDALA